MADEFSYGSIYAEKDEFAMSWKSAVVNSSYDRSPKSSAMSVSNINQYSPVTRAVVETSVESRMETPKHSRSATPTDFMPPKSPVPDLQNTENFFVKNNNDDNKGDNGFNCGIAGSGRIMDNPTFFSKTEGATESSTAKTVALTQKLAFRPMTMPNKRKSSSTIPTTTLSDKSNINIGMNNKTKPLDVLDNNPGNKTGSILTLVNAVSSSPPNDSQLNAGKPASGSALAAAAVSASDGPSLLSTSSSLESKAIPTFLTTSNYTVPNTPTITPVTPPTITQPISNSTDVLGYNSYSNLNNNISYETSQSSIDKLPPLKPVTTAVTTSPSTPVAQSMRKFLDSTSKQTTIVSQRVPYMLRQSSSSSSLASSAQFGSSGNTSEDSCLTSTTSSSKPLIQSLSAPEDLQTSSGISSTKSNTSSNQPKKLIRCGFLEDIEDAVSVKSKSSHQSNETFNNIVANTSSHQYEPIENEVVSTNINGNLRREASIRNSIIDDEKSSSHSNDFHPHSSRPANPTSGSISNSSSLQRGNSNIKGQQHDRRNISNNNNNIVKNGINRPTLIDEKSTRHGCMCNWIIFRCYVPCCCSCRLNK